MRSHSYRCPRNSSRLPANASSCSKLRSTIVAAARLQPFEHASPIRTRRAPACTAPRSVCQPRAARWCDRSRGRSRRPRRTRRLVAELAAELGERSRMSARRPAGIGEPVGSIEHEATGAFEEYGALLEPREIHDARDPVAVFRSAARRARRERRSLRRFFGRMGYSTAVPSACRVNQLFGNTSSGRAPSRRPANACTRTPAAASVTASTSNSRAARAATSEPPPALRWKWFERGRLARSRVNLSRPAISTAGAVAATGGGGVGAHRAQPRSREHGRGRAAPATASQA